MAPSCSLFCPFDGRHPRSLHYHAFVAVLLAVFVAAPRADAVTLTWTTFGNGSFNDQNNWFPTKVPDANDFVSFEVGVGSPYTVTFPGNPLDIGGGVAGAIASYSTAYLRVRDSAVAFSVSTQANRGASTYTVASSTQTEANRAIIVGVGAGDNAALSVIHNSFAGGGLTSFSAATATLGDVASSAGTLNMNFGAFNITGSDFTQTQLIVGNGGVGTLNVNIGADVNVTGFNSTVSLGHHASGVGNVTINGAGSTWTNSDQLWIGENGTGTLTLQNGGTLMTSSAAGDSNIIGVFGGSNGAVTIGAGSAWTSTNGIRVGNSGDGSILVTGGGSLSSTGAGLGEGSTSSGTVTVTGAGSTWSSSGTIIVGSTGLGAMSIQSGGSVTTGGALIRGLNSGSGQVLVAGAGSSLSVTTSPLTIGLPEAGFITGSTSLTIHPGASVDVAHEIELNTNGQLNLQGGTLSADSIGSPLVLSQQIQGTFQWTSGTLHVGTFHGSLTNQGGILAPGHSAGRTTIDGNYTQQAAGALEIEIGGTTPETQHDLVYLEGSASLSGQLHLALINSFAPMPAQTFTIMETVGGISGAFSNAANGQRLGMSGGGSFLVQYGAGSAFDPNNIVLSGFAGPGDFDADGDVDGADFVAWQTHFPTASGATLAGGDADGDGDVDGSDFVVWQTHFPTPPSPANAPVPEPQALLIAAMSAIGAWRLRRRKDTLSSPE
ncbi:MAG: hypothetical protein IT427_15140 [Pirellulales bacterium]|nr:hypothetical protein [Pirellulales bacterium]